MAYGEMTPINIALETTRLGPMQIPHFCQMGSKFSKKNKATDEKKEKPAPDVKVVQEGQWPYMHRHALIHFIGGYVSEDQIEDAKLYALQLKQVNMGCDV